MECYGVGNMIELARDAIRWFHRFLLRIESGMHRVDEYLYYWRGMHEHSADANARAAECERQLDTLGIQA